MKIILTNRLVALSGLVLLLASCRKNSDKPPVNTVPPPTIYVLGTDGDTIKYWKNGVPVKLGNISSGIHYNSISASGTDLYFAVSANAIGLIDVDTAKYWKNGVTTTLPDTTGSAYAGSLYVSGNDVYVAGIQNSRSRAYTYATYWKNGVAFSLPCGGISGGSGYPTTYDDYVSSIFVSGTDVYVAGGSHVYQMGVDSTYRFARYWKNGVPTELTKGLAGVSSLTGTTSYPTTTSIAASGSDVYVSGYEWGGTYGQTTAIYWKNGLVHFLTDSLSGSSANTVAVSGNDVYVGGYANINRISYATIWKNGVASQLTTGTGGSSVMAVFVSGSDVYAVGWENINGYSIAKYWKNGVSTNLSNGTNRAEATSVYVL